MKTTKDAVEHYKGVWPQGCQYVALMEGAFRAIPFSCEMILPLATEVVLKKQFEQYVKETKMEEPKYKSVPVTGMDIWELGKAVAGGGEFFTMTGALIISENSQLKAGRLGQLGISNQLAEGQITTRQPIPWYEVKGVFPCLVKNIYGDIHLITSYEKGKLISERFFEDPKECAPLTPAQAAEYGVKDD